MKDTIKIFGDTYKVDLTQEDKDKIVQKILDWMVEYKISCGESLHQTDNGLLESPNLVSDIIDNVLKPTPVDQQDEF